MDGIAILNEKFFSEGDLVLDSLSHRVSRTPEFKILRAIVLAVAVFVVDCFLGMQCAAKNFFYYFSVFGNLLSVSCENSVATVVNAAAFKLRTVSTLAIAKATPIKSLV